MIAHELAAAAFEMCPSGMLVVDSNGTIVAVNRVVEQMLGYSRIELIGNCVDMLVPVSRIRSHMDLRAAYMRELTTRPMGAGRDLFAQHRDGHEVPVEIGLGPVEIDDQPFILCTIVDISARRTFEDHLRQAQKVEAIGNLASGIAHDFNNILHGIVGYAELIKETVSDKPDVCADVDVIMDAARRGRDLVKHILQFSRKSDASRDPVRIDLLVQEVVLLLRATLPRNIELLTVVDPQTPNVLADATELHQVLMNLANNAAQAMNDTGGVIDVRAEPLLVDESTLKMHPGLHGGLHACLSVTDTGCGMSPAVAERIFEPFFTTKPVGKGTGLGLAVVQRIVRSLGGNIEVRSERSRGTRFDVFLPAATPSALDQPALAKDRSCNQPSILYVDDEERLAQLGRRLLGGAGFNVVAFSSSLQALSEFKEHPNRYDLVITDNNMPHMAGVELARAITRIRPSVPIVMVSGNGDAMDADELRRAGIRRLISKPYSFPDLREAITELIAGVAS